MAPFPPFPLAALYAARRGYQVELQELRDDQSIAQIKAIFQNWHWIDPKFGDPSARPSIALIPLALSERGIRAIACAGVPGLIENVMDPFIPMHTRMIYDHDKNGNLKLYPIPYGPN